MADKTINIVAKFTQQGINKVKSATKDINKEYSKFRDSIEETAKESEKFAEDFTSQSKDITDNFLKNIRVQQKFVRNIQAGNRTVIGFGESLLGADNNLIKATKSFSRFTNDVLDSQLAIRGFVENIGKAASGEFGRSFTKNIEDAGGAINFLSNTLESLDFSQIIGAFTRIGKLRTAELASLGEPLSKLKDVIDRKFGNALRNIGDGFGESFKRLKTTLQDKINFDPKNLQLPNLIDSFKSLKTNVIGLVPALGSLAPALGAVGGAIASVASVAAPLIAVFATGFFGLKEAFRTVNIEPVRESFDRLTASFGANDKLLNELRDSAGGTIREFELLKSTNLALAGATGEVRDTFGEALPRLLEIARVQSRATGQSVDFLFESLVTGIKRGSPLLIDNTGLVLKSGEANEAYAKSIGKTVEQLTANEKQIALVNATLEAGNIAIEAAGGIYETNADRVKQFSNILGDLRDDFGSSFQPLLEVVLRVKLAFANLFSDIVTPINRALRVVNEIILSAFNAINNALKPFANFIGSLINLIKALLIPFNVEGKALINTLNVIGNVLNFVFSVIKPFTTIINGVASIVAHFNNRMRELVSVASFVGSIFVESLLPTINAIGGGFDALGRAILNPIRAMLGLQKATADFSFNLSNTVSQLVTIINFYIDQWILGTARLFGVWIAQASNAGIQILKVVADIANAIGDFLIGQSPAKKGALSKIDEGGRNIMLAWLDGFAGTSLQPVEEVAQSVVNILAPVANLTLNQVRNRLKELDKEIQPFINKVEILQAQLDKVKDSTDKALEAIDKQQQKLIESFNAGNTEAVEAIRLLDKQKEVLLENLDARESAVAQSRFQLALKQNEQAVERTLLQQRLKGVKASEKQAKRAKATTKATKALAKARKSASESGGSGGEPQEAGSGGAGIGESLAGVPQRLQQQFGELSTFSKDVLGEIGQGFLETYDSQGIARETGRIQEGTAKIGEGLSSIGERITKPFENAVSTIQDIFKDLSLSKIIGAQLSGISAIIEAPFNTAAFLAKQAFRGLINFLTLVDQEGGLLNAIYKMPELLIEPFSLIQEKFETFISGDEGIISKFQPAIDFFGTGENSLYAKFNQLINNISLRMVVLENIFNGMVTSITTILSSIPSLLDSMIRQPIVRLFNGLATKLEEFVNDVIDNYNDFIQRIPGPFRPDSIDFRLSLPKLDLPPIQGAATGGLFTGGLLEVGERGRELVTSADKKAVFPNEFVTSMQRLTKVIENSMVLDMASSRPGFANGATNITNEGAFSPVINTNQNIGLTMQELDSIRRGNR